MKQILITGANGQLGSELKKIAASFPNLIFHYTDIETLDLTDYNALEDYFKKNHTDYIINCAAYTAVDKAENDLEMAEKINIGAVKNLSILSKKTKSKLIHISTDYVFDSCLQNVPFKESDKTNAISAYGKTKLIGEEEAKHADNYIIIRTSWLYSAFGNNFVKTILRLGKERSELGVVFDQVGTPCYAADLAESILRIIELSESNEVFYSGIYHFSNEGVCSWYDFALEIVKKAGLACKIKPIETKDYPLPAKRPPYSVLNKSKIKETFGLSIPHWSDSLDVCLKELL
jgi:dTDP-4-dehydrorhamnose reductase